MRDVRVVKRAKICDEETYVLFDTGAAHSYVRRDLIRGECLLGRIREIPHTVVLGGKRIRVTEKVAVRCEVDGVSFSIYAVPVDDLGEITTPSGRVRLGAIIGSLDMERWEIIVIPSRNDVDLSAIRRGEFVEY